MLKCVIFDMDGVIIDSEPIHLQIAVDYCRELGLLLTDEEFNSFVGTSDREMFTILKKKYGLEESLETMVETFSEHCREHVRLDRELEAISGVEELIHELQNKNILLAVASSSARKSIETVLNKFNLAQYFSLIVSGAELEQSKPAPDIFLRTAALLGVNPVECVVIEDSANGVRGAKAAGMKCIGYRNPNSGLQDLSPADMLIKSFNEINFSKILSLIEEDE